MKRWKLAACGLLLGLASVVWAWPSMASAALNDAELTDLWGGRAETFCSVENGPTTCQGFDYNCDDHIGGQNPGDPCWPDNQGIYYWEPESCGASSQGGGAPCNGQVQFVRCVTNWVCRTIRLSNGRTACVNDTATHTNVLISTDLDNCRYVVTVPIWELEW